MLGMNKKVWILSSKKSDGRYNHGRIVGIDKCYNYLGFRSESQFIKDFTVENTRLHMLTWSLKKVAQNGFIILMLLISSLSKLYHLQPLRYT